MYLCRAALPFAFILLFADAHAVSVRAVVLSGDPAPGLPVATFHLSSTTLLRVDSLAPAINYRGDIAFGASTRQNSTGFTGLWLEEGGTLREVVLWGDPAVGETNTLNGLGVPILTASGNTIFTASQNSPCCGALLMRDSAIGLESIAAEGANNFGSQLVQAIFGSVAANDDHVIFVGRVQVGFPSQQRLFRVVEDGYATLAINGGVAPVIGSPFTLQSISSVSVNDSGQVAFNGSLSNRSTTAGGAVYTGGPGELRVVARHGDRLPGNPENVTIDYVNGSKITRDGDIIFYASTRGLGATTFGNTVVLAEIGGQLRTVARQGTAVPGIAGDARFWNLASDDLLMNQNDEIALVARMTGNDIDATNDTGIWAGPWDDLKLIAREGDAVHGADGVFLGDLASSAYTLSMNSRGQVAIQLQVKGDGINSSNDMGLFATNLAGDLRLIALEGKPLEISPGLFKTVREIGFHDGSNNEDGLRSGFNDSGYVAFAATFVDQDISYGVFVSDLVAIPEPTSLSTLLTIGIAFAVSQRWRWVWSDNCS